MTWAAVRQRAEHVAKAVWQRGREIELLHRAMAFAALCFVTLVPLLIVIAAASPTGGIGISDWVIDGLGLSGASAQAVNDLFSSRREVLSTTTALGLAGLSFFGISLMTAVQNAYERIWRVESAAWHAVWRQVVALAGLIGYVLVAEWSGEPWGDTPVQPALRVSATLICGVLFFWWLQRLLLGFRIRWRALLPGAVATVAALVGLRVFSRLVFAPLIASNAITYGVIGTVFVVQSWMIGVGYCVYAGALAGEALHRAHPKRYLHGPH
ncbi:hypothetical protein KCMC57_up07450 [Kitasatospora sp. CMC57]|uniref:Uncharacterized protein n=1 Tax=Kitasatospora sp. CMC57 TaxID=3231513 RepID=A0AB33JNH6_9ACTN